MKYFIIILLLLNSCYLSRDAKYFSIKNKKLTSNTINDIKVDLKLFQHSGIPFYQYPSNKIYLVVSILDTKKNNLSSIVKTSDIKIKIEYDSLEVKDSIRVISMYYKNVKHIKYGVTGKISGTEIGGYNVFGNSEIDSDKLRYAFEDKIVKIIKFNEWYELKYIPEELNFTIIIKDKEYKFKKLRKFEFYSFKIYHI